MEANKFGKRDRRGKIIVDPETIGPHFGLIRDLLRETISEFSPEYNDLVQFVWNFGESIAKERDAVIAELRDEIELLGSEKPKMPICPRCNSDAEVYVAIENYVANYYACTTCGIQFRTIGPAPTEEAE